MTHMLARLALLAGALGTAAASAGERAAPEAVTPAEVVEAFHAALRAGDRESALALLSPQVRVFEQGRMEASREEYAREHLDADIAFSKATARTVQDRSVRASGALAWVLSQSLIEGTFRDAPVSVHSSESVLLERGAGGWRIVHIHWSSARRSP